MMRLLLLLLVGRSSVSQQLGLTVTGNCSYTISVDENPWLSSNVTGLRSNSVWLSSSPDGGLALDGMEAVTGTDPVFGPFSGYECRWGGGLMITRSLLLQPSSSPLSGASGGILFEQVFLDGLTGCSSGSNASDSNDLATAFPTFTLPSDGASPFAFASWAGSSDWPMPEQMGQWSAGGILENSFGFMGSVVAVLNASLVTLAISPLNEYMTSHGAIAASLGGGVYGMGYSGRVSSLPPGRMQRSLLVSGPCVNDTLLAVGSALLAVSGKVRPGPNAVTDVSTGFLSYWTDNGSFFYYRTEKNKTYEETILDVLRYERETLSLPIRSVQFDSWWYFKGPYSGVTSWEPLPTVFPSGMSPWPNLPLVLHNRMFEDVNDYSSNYSFIVDTASHIALPQDEALFLHIMGLAQNWGMIEYEQDWLITVFRGVDAAQSDVSAADTWLNAMGLAASSLNLTIQYCMALPRFLLKSTEVAAVTNARASPDYQPGQNDWAMGFPSMLHWAVALQPSKDNFWTTDLQPNCSYGIHCSEPNTLLHALVATLSTGPVGIGDAINRTNASLVMATCRAGDGLILKPERPMTTMEAALRVGAGKAIAAVGPNVTVPLDALYSTWNAHGPGRTWRWHYCLAVNVSSDVYSLSPSDFGPTMDAQQGFIAFDFFCPTCPGLPVNDAAPLAIQGGTGQPSAPANALPLRYFVLAPLLPSGHVLYGEMGKFAPMSGQRMLNFAANSSGFSVDIQAAADGESSLNVLVALPGTLTLETTLCQFQGPANTTRMAHFACSAAACSCE